MLKNIELLRKKKQKKEKIAEAQKRKERNIKKSKEIVKMNKIKSKTKATNLTNNNTYTSSNNNTYASSNNNNTNSPNKSQTINFTIKDKREQCEAIGFKPQTEKFADCVLRLVELDVKKQQSNEVVSNNNASNNMISKQLEIQNKELERQRRARNSQFLLNLGQQLLNPKTTNSNIYMPQTQRCTIQGFGTFANMICR